MKQADLEEATGIGHSTISGYWSGRLRLGDTNAPKIARALGVSLEVLLAEIDPPSPDETKRRLQALEARDDVDPDVVAVLELLARRLDALDRGAGRATESGE